MESGIHCYVDASESDYDLSAENSQCTEFSGLLYYRNMLNTAITTPYYHTQQQEIYIKKLSSTNKNVR